MTTRQKAIIAALHDRDYFYTRSIAKREIVYHNLKQLYPSLRMKDIEKAISLEIENILKNEEIYKHTILGEMYF